MTLDLTQPAEQIATLVAGVTDEQLADPTPCPDMTVAGLLAHLAMLAQAFTDERWFHSRPSAADYATLASGASNLAPSNPALGTRVLAQADEQFDAQQGPVPLALLTTSASGLDPDLPPAAVSYQVPRVARERGLPESTLRALVQAQTRSPAIGPEVVNVLALNLALDRLTSQSQ